MCAASGQSSTIVSARRDLDFSDKLLGQANVTPLQPAAVSSLSLAPGRKLIAMPALNGVRHIYM